MQCVCIFVSAQYKFECGVYVCISVGIMYVVCISIVCVCVAWYKRNCMCCFCAVWWYVWMHVQRYIAYASVSFWA